MRIMFLGDLAPTGFGSVTRDLGRAMLDAGEDVRFVSQNVTGEDLPEPFRARTVNLLSLVTSTNHLSGEQGISGPAHDLKQVLQGSSQALLASGEPAGNWKPDAVIILADFGALRLFMDEFGEAFSETPTYHYCPVEGVSLPPRWAETWRTVAPVAMSNFGADQIARVTGIRPPVVYHGVDIDTFRPVSKVRPFSFRGEKPSILSTKDDCKREWVGWLMEQNGLERIPRNWLLRTDSHWPRKRYNSMIRALVPVLARHPDWAMVIHCQPRNPGGDLRDTLSKVPEQVRSQFILTHAYGIPRDLLVTLYNAADLYVSTSAEGFGLTIAEALACGVPVVAADYSAVPEVVGPAGRLVPAYPVDNEYDHFWCAVDEQEFGRAVEYLMTHKTKREDLGRLGPGHVASSFQWAIAARDFIALIHASVPQGVAA